MLFSIALILICGLVLGGISKKVSLPPLFGMIFTGVILGPFALNLIHPSLMGISADLRKIALIIILIRAGLSLDMGDLRKVGRPAILMCFVPACFEILGMVLMAPLLFNISKVDAAILGSVVAAVSPAVIVPKMIKLIDEGYGVKEGIPQMILAGASVDDVFVIVMFSAFTGLAKGESLSIMSFLNIPLAILMGIIIGIFVGNGVVFLYKKIKVADTVKIIILLSFSFLLVTAEDFNSSCIPFSGLISVMTMANMLKRNDVENASILSLDFSKLWIVAEIVLFVLVGATVNIKYAISAGFSAVILILGAILFRMSGVFLSVLKTSLNTKERIFCCIAYTPKATVQAAIGAIPLAMGLSCGNIVLTVAVLSILITAPLGAFLIELLYKKLLKKVLYKI
ncbi:sodium/proton antiporter, CPA1 family [Hathewaya proteolytica DSM 3090]|uniref:Sodium/proton antiporter, CPA1 family n=1 Tax=Hathewaya proteolytica DSM 3090 TaxID=1121331 RepID=A0A1M6JEV1_9CLOT|nr:cation:proton antiporter [Hathewaya proteolytica]SHJ45175.1 sodium/proton antiporter, CPA1 family [Hathewaya proteolytica DSM 3090]